MECPARMGVEAKRGWEAGWHAFQAGLPRSTPEAWRHVRLQWNEGWKAAAAEADASLPIGVE